MKSIEIACDCNFNRLIKPHHKSSESAIPFATSKENPNAIRPGFCPHAVHGLRSHQMGRISHWQLEDRRVDCQTKPLRTMARLSSGANRKMSGITPTQSAIISRNPRFHKNADFQIKMHAISPVCAKFPRPTRVTRPCFSPASSCP